MKSFPFRSFCPLIDCLEDRTTPSASGLLSQPLALLNQPAQLLSNIGQFRFALDVNILRIEAALPINQPLTLGVSTPLVHLDVALGSTDNPLALDLHAGLGAAGSPGGIDLELDFPAPSTPLPTPPLPQLPTNVPPPPTTPIAPITVVDPAVSIAFVFAESDPIVAPVVAQVPADSALDEVFAEELDATEEVRSFEIGSLAFEVETIEEQAETSAPLAIDEPLPDFVRSAVTPSFAGAESAEAAPVSSLWMRGLLNVGVILLSGLALAWLYRTHVRDLEERSKRLLQKSPIT